MPLLHLIRNCSIHGAVLASGLLATASAATAEVPTVLTDMPVVQSLVAQVMGNLGSPDVLLQQGADVHSFQLRPSQAQAVATAGLLFWVGHPLTPWLESTIAAVGMKGQSIELLDSPGLNLRPYAPEASNARETDDQGATTDAGGAGTEHEGHDHHGTDPHAWLDPANARVWVDAIAAALSNADPQNAPTYDANARKAKAGIDATEARVKAILAPVGDAPIVVYHDAYGYFSAQFGVNIVGELELGDAAAPSAEKLASLRATLLQDAAVCIFPEAQHDPKLLISVTDGTGVRIGAPVDPEGTSLTYGPDLYGNLMTGLAQAIADCVTAKG